MIVSFWHRTRRFIWVPGPAFRWTYLITVVTIVMLVLNLIGFSAMISRPAPSDIATVVDVICGAAIGSFVLLVVLIFAVYVAVIGGPSRFDKMLRPVIGLSLGIDLVANSIGMARSSTLEALVEPTFRFAFTAASFYAVGAELVGVVLAGVLILGWRDIFPADY
jgi:hypothetical protein